MQCSAPCALGTAVGCPAAVKARMAGRVLACKPGKPGLSALQNAYRTRDGESSKPHASAREIAASWPCSTPKAAWCRQGCPKSAVGGSQPSRIVWDEPESMSRSTAESCSRAQVHVAASFRQWARPGRWEALDDTVCTRCYTVRRVTWCAVRRPGNDAHFTVLYYDGTPAVKPKLASAACFRTG